MQLGNPERVEATALWPGPIKGVLESSRALYSIVGFYYHDITIKYGLYLPIDHASVSKTIFKILQDWSDNFL